MCEYAQKHTRLHFLCMLLFQGSSKHLTPHRYWSAVLATIANTLNFDQTFI